MAWRIEARLVAATADGDREVPVGSTASGKVVQVVADALLSEAERDAVAAEAVDPVLGLVARSEVEKLRSVIERIPGPSTLQVVPGPSRVTSLVGEELPT